MRPRRGRLGRRGAEGRGPRGRSGWAVSQPVCPLGLGIAERAWKSLHDSFQIIPFQSFARLEFQSFARLEITHRLWGSQTDSGGRELILGTMERTRRSGNEPGDPARLLDPGAPGSAKGRGVSLGPKGARARVLGAEGDPSEPGDRQRARGPRGPRPVVPWPGGPTSRPPCVRSPCESWDAPGRARALPGSGSRTEPGGCGGLLSARSVCRPGRPRGWARW